MEVVNNFIAGGRNAMVIGYGPVAFMIDQGNAATDAQNRLLAGTVRRSWCTWKRLVGENVVVIGTILVTPHQLSLKVTTTP